MKIINVGLSVLISMGLAISPIHANDFDVADESNEQSVVNNDDTSNENKTIINSEDSSTVDSYIKNMQTEILYYLKARLKN